MFRRRAFARCARPRRRRGREGLAREPRAMSGRADGRSGGAVAASGTALAHCIARTQTPPGGHEWGKWKSEEEPEEEGRETAWGRMVARSVSRWSVIDQP